MIRLNKKYTEQFNQLDDELHPKPKKIISHQHCGCGHDHGHVLMGVVEEVPDEVYAAAALEYLEILYPWLVHVQTSLFNYINPCYLQFGFIKLINRLEVCYGLN